MTAIKVKYVNQPKKPDGKFGNIKAEDGSTYFVPIASLSRYRAGMEFDAPTAPAKWGQDVVQIIAANFDPVSGSAPIATPSARQAPMQAARGCDKDVLITATALMKSFIETGSFGLTDLETLMKACVPAAQLMVKAASGVPSNDH